MNMVGLVADAATTIQNETEQITKFFSWTHLKEMLNALGNWSVSLIGTIIIAVIIWVIGKKIIKVLTRVVKKMLDRSSLDEGVVNFAVSVLRFVMYAVLIMIVVDKLGFQTTSLLTLFGIRSPDFTIYIRGYCRRCWDFIRAVLSRKSALECIACFSRFSCIEIYRLCSAPNASCQCRFEYFFRFFQESTKTF